MYTYIYVHVHMHVRVCVSNFLMHLGRHPLKQYAELIEAQEKG